MRVLFRPEEYCVLFFDLQKIPLVSEILTVPNSCKTSKRLQQPREKITPVYLTPSQGNPMSYLKSLCGFVDMNYIYIYMLPQQRGNA